MVLASQDTLDCLYHITATSFQNQLQDILLMWRKNLAKDFQRMRRLASFQRRLTEAFLQKFNSVVKIILVPKRWAPWQLQRWPFTFFPDVISTWLTAIVHVIAWWRRAWSYTISVRRRRASCHSFRWGFFTWFPCARNCPIVSVFRVHFLFFYK